MRDPSSRPPVVVVALGDPGRRDDGIALRVMGRVRTLIGQIGCSRSLSHHRRSSVRVSGPGDAGGNTGVSVPESLLMAGSEEHGGFLEWVEGGTQPEKLDSLLVGRRRVILMDAVQFAHPPGSVHHWHVACAPRSRLSTVRHLGGRPQLGLQHLALWLEDDLPARGTDLIGIEPFDLSEGQGLSRPIRRQLPSISSRVAGILLRILEEEGW